MISITAGAELLQTLETFPDPVVLVGDFNSAADSSTTATYALLTAQFTDAFAMARPGEDGYTCCQRPDLLNEASVLSTRIDLILYRGPVEAAQVRLVGASPLDRIDGLWPSDHAGVVATLEVEN